MPITASTTYRATHDHAIRTASPDRRGRKAGCAWAARVEPVLTTPKAYARCERLEHRGA
jgi:hypothetical protein